MFSLKGKYMFRWGSKNDISIIGLLPGPRKTSFNSTGNKNTGQSWLKYKTFGLRQSVLITKLNGIFACRPYSPVIILRNKIQKLIIRSSTQSQADYIACKAYGTRLAFFLSKGLCHSLKLRPSWQPACWKGLLTQSVKSTRLPWGMCEHEERLPFRPRPKVCLALLLTSIVLHASKGKHNIMQHNIMQFSNLPITQEGLRIFFNFFLSTGMPEPDSIQSF